MTTQDKHITSFFRALDNFGKGFDEGWLTEMKKHREWLERDIAKRENDNADRLQRTLFR